MYQNVPSEATVKSVGVPWPIGSAHSLTVLPTSRPIRRLVASTHHTALPNVWTTDGRDEGARLFQVVLGVIRHSPVDEATKTSLPLGAGARSRIVPTPAGRRVTKPLARRSSPARKRVICAEFAYQTMPPGERVIEIGLLRPKKYPVVSPAGVTQVKSWSVSTTHTFVPATMSFGFPGAKVTAA